MRKIVGFIICIFIGIVGFVGCGGLQPDPDDANTFSISYQSSVDGFPIPDAMFIEDGNYPQSYTLGESVQIDGLTETYRGGGFEYVFKGWFWDKDCTQAFEQIGETQTGNVTLYAEFSIAAWSERL